MEKQELEDERKEEMDYIQRMLWSALTTTTPKQRHICYASLYGTEAQLTDALAISGLTLAPNVFAALTAPCVPPLDIFKGLPLPPSETWGVYLAVLEKDGDKPMLYVGSETARVGGVATRVRQYTSTPLTRSDTRPARLRNALFDGYSIPMRRLGENSLTNVI
jgi:hypothetical protein